ncbi:hypothetical protein SBOR_9242 [Sclerotinia borealis F-4128]|uniref:Major facilitator superfamily (MFS) profile domain-containing protein n=1 Tax=Sclerotinia borealis (strain F-4128) TaxID=1432307 RepID=W9C744_SCLBF|nr:hypothetical protein SBOR_9242 [Sclerotinia borealis F-4128]
MKNSTLGKIRAYWLASVVCGVLTLKSFVHDLQYSTDHATRVSSLAVGLQQAGAFVTCFFIWLVADRIGSKLLLQISASIFIVGAVMETVNSHSMAVFYVGRVIVGVGLGAASVVVPMFNAEMTPKELRGQIGSFFQWFYTFGIFTSYWVDYAMAEVVSSVSRQWQIPIGLQIIPAGILATIEEMEEIRAGVEMEQTDTIGFRIKELGGRDNFKRMFTASAIFATQQATGATAFAYYGPEYFKLVGGGNKDLLLTAIFGAIKIVACGLFVLFLSNRIGRRAALIGGVIFMGACQITTAVVVKELPASKTAGVISSGIATVALIYIFVIAYNLSFFPTRTREPGGGTFLLWGLFDAIIAIVSFFFPRETQGLSLEEIAHNDYGRAATFKEDAELVEHGLTNNYSSASK